MRWITRYVPEFEKRWNRFACRAGVSWRVDETYVKIKGRWTYLYRAVDKQGKTVAFFCSAPSGMSRRRKRFFVEHLRARVACLTRSRSMVIRLRIGRRGKYSTNISAGSEPKFDPQNI
jgi:transposase-like protein